MKDRSFEPVLAYWFGALNDGLADDAHRHLWFNGEAHVDDAIRERFEHLLSAAKDGLLTRWLQPMGGCLAFILVCDQFPRNIFRGKPEAFAYDALALETCKNGIETGAHLELGFDERSFFYLPLEHSEQMADQQRCVDLFTQLRDETPKGLRHITGDYLRHAHQHRDIIARFGRFPHRNVVLGRSSSPEELAFLTDGGGFGQQPQ
ncbi:MAG: DUF924 domain-containing protein [Gammaproteobacteria bacterium]|nr:DUF924 domain-containing protein [Gammaproteobacteria bacterium]